MSAGSKSVVTLPKALLVVLLSFTVACGADHDKLVIDPEPRPDRPGEVQEDAAAAEILIEVAEAEQEAVESRESVETGPDESAIGPFRVGGDIERPRHLGDRPPIEGLTAMMRSGDYAWGACIFQVTISEKGEVGDVEFLKPEDLASEVREVIAEAVQDWRFSPATRAGEPIAVYYNLVIHHCPYQRVRGDDG